MATEYDELRSLLSRRPDDLCRGLSPGSSRAISDSVSPDTTCNKQSFAVAAYGRRRARVTASSAPSERSVATSTLVSGQRERIAPLCGPLSLARLAREIGRLKRAAWMTPLRQNPTPRTVSIVTPPPFELASQMGDVDVDEIRPWVEVVAESTSRISWRDTIWPRRRSRSSSSARSRGESLTGRPSTVGVVGSSALKTTFPHASGAQRGAAARRPRAPRRATDLRARERLDDVVISPGFERAHHVVETGARGRHQDRRPHAELPCSGDHIDAVHVGQAHVHDGGIQIVPLETSQRSGAGPDDIYPKSPAFERCFRGSPRRADRPRPWRPASRLQPSTRDPRHQWICKPDTTLDGGLHDLLMIAELSSASADVQHRAHERRAVGFSSSTITSRWRRTSPRCWRWMDTRPRLQARPRRRWRRSHRKDDALITDFRMTDGNGAELIAEIRRRGSRIPAVVMTAYADDATDECVHDGGSPGRPAEARRDGPTARARVRSRRRPATADFAAQAAAWSRHAEGSAIESDRLLTPTSWMIASRMTAAAGHTDEETERGASREGQATAGERGRLRRRLGRSVLRRPDESTTSSTLTGPAPRSRRRRRRCSCAARSWRKRVRFPRRGCRRPEGSTKLRACLQALDPAVATEAAAALFGTFLELITTFIGERLTIQVLRSAWPTIEDTAPRETKK